jgi:hypothetical protein
MPPPPLATVLPDDVPRQLAAATIGWTKLRRAAAYASFDAWSMAALGLLSLLCGAYSSVSGLFVSAVLLVAAYVEFRGVARLRRLDLTALPHLAYNQLGLAGALIIYGIFSLIQIAHGGGLVATVNEQLSAAGSGSAGPEAQEMVVEALELMYILLIAFAIFVQGGTALFYLSRRKHLQNYLESTPEWIQQMHREKGQGFPVIGK